MASCADQIAELRARRVHQRHGADHDVLDGQVANLQGQVESEGLVDRQLDAAAHLRREAGELGPELVAAGRQRWHHVATLATRRDRPRQAGRGAGDRHRHAWQHRAAAVPHDPADRAGRLRRSHRDQRRTTRRTERKAVGPIPLQGPADGSFSCGHAVPARGHQADLRRLADRHPAV